MKFIQTKGKTLVNAATIREIYITGEKSNEVKVMARFSAADRVITTASSKEEAHEFINQLWLWLNDKGDAPQF